MSKPRTSLSDAHRRDLEMILVGFALASAPEVRAQIADELRPTDPASGGIMSQDAFAIVDSIAAKRSGPVFDWLLERGVTMDRGVSVRHAIAERLAQDAHLAVVRSLCQRLTFSQAMTAEEITRIASLILRASPAGRYNSPPPAPQVVDAGAEE